MNTQVQRKGPFDRKIEPAKFIQRSNGTIKGYAVNTFHGLVKNYNEDRVSIIMNITKPNFKGRWPRCSYFAVFDGHGGNKCSDFLKENMHKYITENSHFPHQPIQALQFGFKKAQQQFLSFAQSQNPVERSGSCALVVLIIDQICYIANVGDSRAILSANLGKKTFAISNDHKPDSETQRERILNAGGKIYQSSMKSKNGSIVLGPYRLQPGKLSVSRSFGDIQAKLPKYNGNPKVLIAKPEITYFEIKNEQHDFIMLCSDGVFDKLSNEEVAECFWETKDSKKEDSNQSQFIGSVTAKVIEKSMEKMSFDNLTSLIIVFQDHGRFNLPNKRPYKRSQQQISNKCNLESEVKDCYGERKNTGKTQECSQSFTGINENWDTNRIFLKERLRDTKCSNLVSQTYGKRKNSTNTLAHLTGKLPQSVQHQSPTLISSTSAKMLIDGSKAFQKSKIDRNQKTCANGLISKKMSVDIIKKESFWKQISQKNRELKQKHIRF